MDNCEFVEKVIEEAERDIDSNLMYELVYARKCLCGDKFASSLDSVIDSVSADSLKYKKSNNIHIDLIRLRYDDIRLAGIVSCDSKTVVECIHNNAFRLLLLFFSLICIYSGRFSSSVMSFLVMIVALIIIYVLEELVYAAFPTIRGILFLPFHTLSFDRVKRNMCWLDVLMRSKTKDNEQLRHIHNKLSEERYDREFYELLVDVECLWEERKHF